MPVNAGACAISVAFAMLFATLLAAGLNRWSSHSARTYRIVTSGLVVASLAAPLSAAGTGTATKVTLIWAHLVGAAVIIPIVSRCLEQTG